MKNQQALRRIVNEEVRRNLASSRYALNEGFWTGLLKLGAGGLGLYWLYNMNGIDCSAFTKKVYKDAFGIDLPRTGSAQQKVCQDIPLSQIQKGDLVFLKNTSNNRPPGHVTHVGVYVGNGKVAHASAGAHKKTVIVPMNNYWTCAEHFAGVGRPDRTKIQSKIK